MNDPDAPCSLCKVGVPDTEPYALFVHPQNKTAQIFHAECYKKWVIDQIEVALKE